jgi:hypothetical protein
MDDAMVSEEDGHQLAVDTKTPEAILTNRADSQLVQRAIDDLPVHYRETLLLSEVEEMSYQGSPTYWRSRRELLCRAWPEPARQFESQYLALRPVKYRVHAVETKPTFMAIVLLILHRKS